jgi:hypothetical protein
LSESLLAAYLVEDKLDLPDDGLRLREMNSAFKNVDSANNRESGCSPNALGVGLLHLIGILLLLRSA